MKIKNFTDINYDYKKKERKKWAIQMYIYGGLEFSFVKIILSADSKRLSGNSVTLVKRFNSYVYTKQIYIVQASNYTRNGL